jgi:Glycosidases
MQWDASSAGGFTAGEPWLPPIDPAERNVEAQSAEPGSLLNHYRRLIAARRELGSAFGSSTRRREPSRTSGTDTS